MYNEKKIKIMSQMALYDKHGWDADYRKYQYFRHDYIYCKNAWTRFYAAIGCVILSGLYVMHLFAVEDLNPVQMIADGTYLPLALRLLTFTAVVLVGYTVLGTLIHTIEYQKARGRIDEYNALGEELERISAKIEKPLLDQHTKVKKDFVVESEEADAEPKAEEEEDEFVKPFTMSRERVAELARVKNRPVTKILPQPTAKREPVAPTAGVLLYKKGDRK
jgi:hypothetical protein